MTSTKPTELRRVLGPLSAGCIVIGAVIGVGIFFTPRIVARLAGSGEYTMLAWGIAGVIALFGALAFAELGGLYHRSGAQYEILRDAYGPLTGFLFVFCNATAIQAGAIAIIAVVCMQNLTVAMAGKEPTPALQLGGAIGLIVLLTLANLIGVRWGSTIQNITVVIKVGALILITLLAATNSPTLPASSAMPTTGAMAGLFAALVPAHFSFGGWQHALWIAGEIRDPKRNIPRAIIGGMVIVVGVYLLANWAYLHLLGHAGVAGSQALAAEAVATVWGDKGRRAIGMAIALSAFGVLNAQLLSGPRLVYGMATDGRFFRTFGAVHEKFGTPIAAILLLSGMALVLLMAAGYEAVDRILTGAVMIDSIFFVLTAAAVYVLRRRVAGAGALRRGVVYTSVPALFMIGETAVLIGAWCDAERRSAAVIGAAWIAAAAVCYALFFRQRRGVELNVQSTGD